MSAFDVLDNYGTAALLRFVGAVVLFTLLHLLRWPFVLLARLLEVGMGRLDAYLTCTATTTARTVPEPAAPAAQDRARFYMPAGAGS